MGRPPSDGTKRLSKRIDAIERRVSDFANWQRLSVMTDALRGIAPFAAKRIRELSREYAESGSQELEDELQRWVAVTSAIRSLPEATSLTDTERVT